MAAISDFNLAAAQRSFEEARFRGLTLQRRAAALRLHSAELRRASAEALQDARLACAAARTICGAPQPVPITQHPGQPSISAPARIACPLDGVDIDELAGDLIAAYQAATVFGDEETQGFLREALTLVGRHLAERVEPRAAGVRLN